MPSPHLQRKLQESLGDDAGEELAAVIDRVDPIRGDIAELRHSVAALEQSLRHEMQLGFARLEAQGDRTTALLLKWSFAFWVGAVGAIAALAGILR